MIGLISLRPCFYDGGWEGSGLSLCRPSPPPAGLSRRRWGGGGGGVEICEVLWSSTGISKNDLKTFASLKLLAQTWQIAKLGFPQGVHDFETKNYVLPYGLGLSMSALVKF